MKAVNPSNYKDYGLFLVCSAPKGSVVSITWGDAKDEMTGHGFRSMESTLLHELGLPHAVIERQLAHGERNRVSAAYNFAEHLP